MLVRAAAIIKYIWTAFWLVSLCTNNARAQYITDKTQERKWFELQHIAEEQAIIAKCVSFELTIELERNPAAKEAFWRQFHSIADKVANEIEAYVAQYEQTRGSGETLGAFRFRVWSVTLEVGRKGAEENFTRAVCATYCQQNDGPTSH